MMNNYHDFIRQIEKDQCKIQKKYIAIRLRILVEKIKLDHDVGLEQLKTYIAELESESK
jgi:uncharacterized protein YjaG (DUF416 family)